MNRIVKKAVNGGRVTLLNRVFGRGTDFICYDRDLIREGGVHVLQVIMRDDTCYINILIFVIINAFEMFYMIQTFVSEEKSEEVQIMGRTARQGNTGSYSLVLLDDELEKYKLNNKVDEMKATNKFHSKITEEREKFVLSKGSNESKV